MSALPPIVQKLIWLAILGALVLVAGRIFSQVQSKAANA